MPRGCWRRTSNTPLGRGSICSPGKIDELEKRLADARQAGQLPALARLGRRTAEQKRLARYRRPPQPADSATGVALWQGDRFEPAIPQNPPHRVLEQQARLAARLGPAGSDLDRARRCKSMCYSVAESPSAGVIQW